MRIKVRAIVFESLQPDTIEIQVGYGYGKADGGTLWKVERDLVPVDCRVPNTYVWVTIESNEVLLVEKMSPKEVEQNKIN